MDKKIAKRIAIALCGVALTGVGTTSIIGENTYIASANHQGTKVWIQYGTLKYALKAPSGRVYPAGTKVARRSYNDNKPINSLPGEPFYLTLIVGGDTPGLNYLTDAGGGKIAEAYVNIGDWNEIDYPKESVALAYNTMDNADLSSSDFHPVDSSNPDVTHADTTALDSAYAEYNTTIDFVHLSSAERNIVSDIDQYYAKATAIGTSQEYVDQTTAYINQIVANYKKTGHLTDSGTVDKPTSPSTSPTTPTTGSGATTTSPTIPTSKSHYVKLRKASYRYTRKGKRVSKKLLKKGSVVKINGKVYRIKGKAFYRIAKNRYIRVVNVSK